MEKANKAAPKSIISTSRMQLLSTIHSFANI